MGSPPSSSGEAADCPLFPADPLSHFRWSKPLLLLAPPIFLFSLFFTNFYFFFNCHRRLDRLEDAERCCKSLLRLQLRSLGEGHAATADALFMLGRLQRKLGKLDQAGRSFADSLRVRLFALGRDDARTGSSFYYLGVVFEEQVRPGCGAGK